MRKVQSDTELHNERIRNLTERLSEHMLGKLKISEFSAFVRVMTLVKIPSDEDLELLEKAAEEIEDGIR